MRFKRTTICAALLVFSTVAPVALAAPGEVSFTPTGLRLSIMRITLSVTDDNGNTSSEQVLYTCPQAAESDCLVDVTNQSELDAIAAQAASARVQVGSYNSLALDLCAADKNGQTPAPGFVRGIFTVPSEGKTYATDPDPSNVTGLREVTAGDDSAADYAAIGNWSCSSKRVLLQTPVVVTKMVAAPVTVMVDKTFIAFSTPNVSPGMGGCRGDADGHGRGVCVSYPSMVPLAGANAPEVDRFLVAHHRTDPLAIDDSKANGYVVVVRNADDGTPYTAFVRPYYSETSAQTTSNNAIVDPLFGGPAYFGDTLINTVHLNADGSLAFTTGGSMDGSSAIFPSFQFVDHRSVVNTRGDGTWQYHAFPILP